MEFTFCFIMILLIIYGCIKAFQWAGVSLAERRIAHDQSLSDRFVNEGSNWDTSPMSGPLRQLQTDFYDGTDMNLVFNGWDTPPDDGSEEEIE